MNVCSRIDLACFKHLYLSKCQKITIEAQFITIFVIQLVASSFLFNIIHIISHISVLFSSGEDIQRASVIINLPILVRQNPAETFRRVVPKVRVGQTMDHSSLLFMLRSFFEFYDYTELLFYPNRKCSMQLEQICSLPQQDLSSPFSKMTLSSSRHTPTQSCRQFF